MSDVAMSADGLPIHFDVHGDGSPEVVLVHGWGCDRRHWQQSFEHFAAQRTVVSLDLGGHGESGLDRDAWTMSAFGQDVVAVVEKLDLRRAVLVGHSMGGAVVVEAALRVPERLLGIIGVDTFKSLDRVLTRAEVEGGMEPFRQNFARATDDFVRSEMFLPTSDAALVDRVAAAMSAAPPRIGLDSGEQFDGHGADLQTGLKNLQVPAMLINSDFQPTDTAAAERYGIRVELMSGTGHFPMLEDPATFNGLLENALQRFA